MIFVPGGAWVHGSRILQGYALMSHLAEHGLGVPVGRLPGLAEQPLAAAHHRRQDRDRVGARQRRQVRRRPRLRGDRGLFGRRPPGRAGRSDRQRPRVQSDLPEGSDTSVDAVVGIYGRYDWEDRSTAERARFVDFLERVVVKRKIDRASRDLSATRRRSPGSIADAPPFLVIHGSGDTVIPVEQARSFVEQLRAVSRSMVSYVELPGAGHGFDMTDGARTGADGHRNRLVPQPDSPKPGRDRGQRGHIAAPLVWSLSREVERCSVKRLSGLGRGAAVQRDAERAHAHPQDRRDRARRR